MACLQAQYVELSDSAIHIMAIEDDLSRKGNPRLLACHSGD